MKESTLVQLSELEAVNEILATIGEAPVDSLVNMSNIDAINAYRILQAVNRREQAKGWSFNKENYHRLRPDAKNNIYWNSLWLYVKSLGGEKLVRAGNLVKDLNRDNTTFKHPLIVEVIFLQDFDELPDAFRNYVIAKASHDFQMRYFGDRDLAQTTQAYVMECWQALQEYELDNNDYNILDNCSVAKLKRRK